MPKTMNMERTVVGTSGWATAEQSSFGAKLFVSHDEVPQELAICGCFFAIGFFDTMIWKEKMEKSPSSSWILTSLPMLFG